MNCLSTGAAVCTMRDFRGLTPELSDSRRERMPSATGTPKKLMTPKLTREAAVRSSELVRCHLVDDLENVNPNAHPIATPAPAQTQMSAGAPPITAPITDPTNAPMADPTATALLDFFLLSFIFISQSVPLNPRHQSIRSLILIERLSYAFPSCCRQPTNFQ